ncbi:hypothetical protein SAMN04487962_1339 [Marinobacter segnicrescens]|uniref:Uncharacterized protein n=1 Tax=Marinobacter segnicrescens TaxID=430453 RepID=A0A1I0HR25_9GAMM|nr:hypothetical protein [Marinobacter segnicrescens]SET86489.1 hypothetical protein SAMN04487962_1339 [Marinobacter segnicrescens]
MAKSIFTLLELPYGVVDAAQITGVSVTDTGVVCVNGDNRAVAWLEFDDLSTRRKAAKQLTQRVMAAQRGEVVEPMNWEELGYEA